MAVDGLMPQPQLHPMTRHFYPAASIEVGGMELVPGIGAVGVPHITVLNFVLPDGTQHAFAFDQEGKKNLIQKLTGVELATVQDLPEQ